MPSLFFAPPSDNWWEHKKQDLLLTYHQDTCHPIFLLLQKTEKGKIFCSYHTQNNTNGPSLSLPLLHSNHILLHKNTTLSSLLQNHMTILQTHPSSPPTMSKSPPSPRKKTTLLNQRLPLPYWWMDVKHLSHHMQSLQPYWYHHKIKGLLLQKWVHPLHLYLLCRGRRHHHQQWCLPLRQHWTWQWDGTQL